MPKTMMAIQRRYRIAFSCVSFPRRDARQRANGQKGK
jgi:hypothetical protein